MSRVTVGGKLGAALISLAFLGIGCGSEPDGGLEAQRQGLHSWGPYHWPRSANPITIPLGDNLNSTWDVHLGIASADWTASEVLNTTIIAGSTRPKVCRATAGGVQVCNATYGSNGWLGIAQIWANSVTGHITQGTVKVNDSYFNTAKYNTPVWRNLVMCQEIGHTFGLNHQDEVFENPPLGSCMDYSDDPLPNQHPNQHDYDQLVAIYTHVEAGSTATVSTGAGTSATGDFDRPENWGELVSSRRGGREHVYVRRFSGGETVVTFVIRAD